MQTKKKDREFIEIDSNLNNLNNQLLQLKSQKASDAFNSSKLINNLLNCLCTKNLLEKNSNTNSKSENINNIVLF